MYDRVEIIVKSGAGGDGAISFRREKFVPYGGPDGGDGGDGGDVLVVADPSLSNLRLFKSKRLYRARNGENGMDNKKHGGRGEDLLIRVPMGTVVFDKIREDNMVLIADMELPAQQTVVARGGRGGLGNVHFASSTNQAPRIAQKGEVGEERAVLLELRLIADVGIIGYPNVGKSTMLTAASAAKPKVAGYPFTTREPVLGVVEVGLHRFVMAEIPGLLDGAHLGRGLGHDFLRHITRTRILIHLVDGSSASPVDDMIRVNNELSLFDVALAQKTQLVTVNKVDLPQVRARLDAVREAFTNAGTQVRFVSAATGEGISELLAETMETLRQVDAVAKARVETPSAVFRPMPRRDTASVRKEGDTFVIVAPALERIVARVDMTNPEASSQFLRQLTRRGLGKTLAKAGVKPGDRVRCGDYEWEW